MPEPFLPSTTELTSAERRALGVLACEQRLGARALEVLAPELTPEFWRRCVERGWVVDAGAARALGSRGTDVERTFALGPGLRPLVLRHLGDLEELDDVQRTLRASSADPARSGFICALYAGDLGAVERALPELERRAVRGQETTFASSMLREAVAASFDAAWLERTWGELGVRLVEQVLADALFALAPVEALYRFASEHLDEATTPGLRWVLAEHALLRGEIALASSFIAGFASREQLGLRAALAYTSGAFADAQQLLSDYDRSHASAHGAASVTALLVLLALSREPPEGAKLARRCLPRRKERAPPLAGWPRLSAEPDLSRALRTLLKRMTQPETERLRLSVHQLPATASPWEAFVHALTVSLQERDEVARLGWARRLVADAERANAGGYSWFSRQAQHLARALSPEALPELRELRPCQAGELLLCELLEPEPEWRRALGALQGFTESVEASEKVVSRRVAWYVDMTNGVPAKPALEEFVRGTGWTRGRRVELDELDAVKDELPPEDRAVLRALDSSHLRRRDLPLELLEGLVGHPRVFNGARGRLPVEITRGTCRVETRREHGHLVISLEPAGATEGVNVVVESETRLAVYRVTPTLGKLFGLVPSGVRIPERHEPEAIGVLSRLAEHVEVRSSSLGARKKLDADSTPVLRISPESGAWYVEVGVRPFGARGRFFPPGLGRVAITTREGDDWLDAERDFEREKASFHELTAACPTLALALSGGPVAEAPGGEGSFSGSLGEEDLFTLLSELKQSELSVVLEWQDGRPVTARGTLGVGALHGALKRNKGWYLVTGGVRIDDVMSLDLAELVTLPFTKSGRFLRLPNGDFVEVERRARRVLSLLASAADPPKRGRPAELRIPEAALNTLRSLRDAGYEFDEDASGDGWLARCDQILATDPPLPLGLTATLRPYQLEGFRWLWRFSQLGLGVCLADDMGLGKTLEAMALLLTRRAGGPALVVAPTSVCRNWLEELRRFAPSLTVLEYTGKGRAALLEPFRSASPPDVLIVSYALLQHDASELSSLTWNTVVLDEAQFIKNAHSLRARAAFALPARYRLAMTGTPVENHLGDLWSIFHFLNPVLLGTWKHFQLRYLKPIERDRNSEQRAELKALIAPFLLRRVKDDVLSDLPPLTVVRHSVSLNEDETLRYALLRRQIHEKLRTAYGKRQHKLQVFTEITRLRRFCCHPRLVYPDAPSEASKLTAFLELAEELRDNGHRALVFSQFVDFLELAREVLDERGIRYSYLDGSTPKETRHTRVEEFQNGNNELFLISLKAGGFGLNLTAADYVIHLDPWWNPAVEAQATDRAHRIGQERPVTVYRLITENTIEERIVELHREKRELADALLSGTDDVPELSHELLTELLGVGPAAEVRMQPSSRND
ncbi:MAG TPA: DEAD/DEAH box helicase [Polyangiaceae bacterium]|nr:DEAD/DEAH box helicase [Polyangiaceae bacterium]